MSFGSRHSRSSLPGRRHSPGRASQNRSSLTLLQRQSFLRNNSLKVRSSILPSRSRGRDDSIHSLIDDDYELALDAANKNYRDVLQVIPDDDDDLTTDFSSSTDDKTGIHNQTITSKLDSGVEAITKEDTSKSSLISGPKKKHTFRKHVHRNKPLHSDDFNLHPVEDEILEFQSDDDEDDQTPLLQYSSPYLAIQPGRSNSNVSTSASATHVAFSESLAFHAEKKNKMWTYMRRHEIIHCHERQPKEEEIQLLLDMIKPPVEIETDEEKNVWMQRISKEPADCDTLEDLEDRLDELLEKRKARKKGICLIRRALYDDCFDEVLRQIAIETPDRAVLLLRCRQEWQQTIRVFESLHCSAEATNSRYDILSTVGMEDIWNRLNKLRDRVEGLRVVSKNLAQEIKESKLKYEIEFDDMNDQHNEELHYLKTMTTRYFQQMDRFTNPNRRVSSSRNVRMTDSRGSKVGTRDSVFTTTGPVREDGDDSRASIISQPRKSRIKGKKSRAKFYSRVERLMSKKSVKISAI